MTHQVVPHEFTGVVVNGEHCCKYCFGTPRECSLVFGPHCEEAAKAKAREETDAQEG